MSDQQPSVWGGASEGLSSATRALALLDIFSRWRRPAGARELAAALGMPRSSTNVLLRALVSEGYVRFDPGVSLYYPSFKVAQLGLWLVQDRIGHPAITRLVNRLSEVTRETVCLWARAGGNVRIVALRDSPQAVVLALRVGDFAPLLQSAVGLALLAALDDAETVRAVEAHNRAAGGPVVVDQAILAEIDRIRTEGMAVAYGRWIADAGAVAAVLPGGQAEPIVVAVGGPAARIRAREEAIREALSSAMEAFGVEQYTA